MQTSFDEVRKIAFRALNAAGAPPGIDEDAGWACAWLEAAGHSGLRMLADVLDAARPSELECRLTQNDHGEIDAGGHSAICIAPLLVEFAAASDGPLMIRNLRHADYLIAHAARLAADGTHLTISPIGEAMIDVTIRAGDDDYAGERQRVADAIGHGLDVDGSAFDRVYGYSRAVLVSQTEASLLRGAGAGLTDND